jgi:hypothetical protein
VAAQRRNDERSEKVNLKIREAQLQKVPFMLVVGGRETQSGRVSVRHRKRGDQGAQDLEAFIVALKQLIGARDVTGDRGGSRQGATPVWQSLQFIVCHRPPMLSGCWKARPSGSVEKDIFPGVPCWMIV